MKSNKHRVEWQFMHTGKLHSTCLPVFLFFFLLPLRLSRGKYVSRNGSWWQSWRREICEKLVSFRFRSEHMGNLWWPTRFKNGYVRKWAINNVLACALCITVIRKYAGVSARRSRLYLHIFDAISMYHIQNVYQREILSSHCICVFGVHGATLSFHSIGVCTLKI